MNNSGGLLLRGSSVWLTGQVWLRLNLHQCTAARKSQSHPDKEDELFVTWTSTKIPVGGASRKYVGYDMGNRKCMQCNEATNSIQYVCRRWVCTSFCLSWFCLFLSCTSPGNYDPAGERNKELMVGLWQKNAERAVLLYPKRSGQNGSPQGNFGNILN